ncbi:MAG: four helix bundle protein [Elusimicrobia bacterium]|nr:four helix bundle protein [Elusimicrobiota bacterium]
MSERPHKKLKIWTKIIAFIEDIYSITTRYPQEEIYGLTSQMRRSAVSVASNIAEGFARRNSNEKIQFCYISRSSLSEIDAQLEISLRLKFIDNKEHENLQEKLDEISRMLNGLINSI